MTRFIASIVVLLLITSQGMSQNRSGLKGIVTDSLTREALGFATVAILDLKDSSLISYTLTVKSGEFAFYNLPANKTLKLVVSFVGYQTFKKVFILKKATSMDVGTIKLIHKGTLLNEVKIIAEITPVIVKKDTIEFSAEAFKTPPNAVVEELLKRLPGIQIDLDGMITVNGKKVSKLLIDGKQFFVNDPNIASKNLDASLFDKIQVYDDRQNDPDHLIPDSKVNKIINLKLKKAMKKSIFGKVLSGGGTRDRFDEGVLYNMFRDTLQISIIGIGNNLDHTGFSNDDLTNSGGFNQSGSNVLNNGIIATSGRSYGGIQTIGSGGINLNKDYGKSLKLNLLYFYNYTSNAYNSSSFNQQFFSDTTLSTASTSINHSTSSRHNVSGLVEWEPDTIVKVRYEPRISFTSNNSEIMNNNNSFNNFLPRLNESVNSSSSSRNSIQFQQLFSYYRKLHKQGASLNITHDLNLSPSNSLAYSTNDLTSYTALLSSSSLRMLEKNTNGNTDASLNLTYRYPFSKKLTGNISVSSNYNYNLGRLFTYNENLQTKQYNIYIDSLSHSLQRYQLTETLRPEVTYQINKETSLSVNVGIQFIQINNKFNRNIPNINQQALYLLPSLRFYNAKLSFNYLASIQQPSINDLVPQTTFYSQLYSTIGNPNLKPTRSHNISLSFYNYKNETLLNTGIYTGITIDENSIFTEKTVNSQGVTIATPINKNGKYNVYLGGNLGKGFKKFDNFQIRLNSKLSGGLDHNFFQVNSNDGYQNTFYINFNQQLSVNYNNIVEISPSYNLNPSITTYQNVGYKNVNYITQSLEIPIIIHWPKHIVVEANYTYTYNPLIATGFQRNINLLNLSIARLIQYQNRGEVKLSCYDLLDQNINAYRLVSGNSITDTQSQILKRYLLLSYAYKFNKTISKK